MSLVAALPMTDDELATGRTGVAEAAHVAARSAATHHLVKGLSGLVSSLAAGAEDAITAALVARDTSAHAWLAPYEAPWALLVLRLLAGTVSDLSRAVLDARERGATVPDIAAAIGITTQGVYATYADQVVRRRRSK